MASHRRPVVVTGGTGYLGQHLIRQLVAKGWPVALLYHSADGADPPAWPDASAAITWHPVDLATGAGLDAAFAAACGLNPPAAVINLAAVSSPAACEADPAGAAAVNVPTHLLAALKKACGGDGGGDADAVSPLFIQLSTDQVYAGAGAPPGGWREADGTLAPVNAYARTKADAEAAVATAWPSNHLILRCSVMVGGGPPVWPLTPPGRVPFLQFAIAEVSAAAAAAAAAAAGGGGAKTRATFYGDEHRSFVGVRDVAAACVAALEQQHAQGAEPPATHHLPSILNMGGPERLSRADLARAVAVAMGVSPDVVAVASVASTAASGRVPSPPDIGMDISRLTDALGFRPRSLGQILAEEVPELKELKGASEREGGVKRIETEGC